MSGQDWTGDTNSVWKTIAATNRNGNNREKDDYYATEPKAIHKLCEVEKFTCKVWECACGAGHLVKALEDNGYTVKASDITDRGCPNSFNQDFFECGFSNYDIITNPPYKYAKEFVEHALDIINDGMKVAMFLKLTFLEGKARREFFRKNPPVRIWVFSERILCAKNGDFEGLKDSGGSAVAYAWFVWEKGFSEKTVIDWL